MVILIIFMIIIILIIVILSCQLCTFVAIIIYRVCQSKSGNFNLNFPLYCAFAKGCYWRPKKSDASSKSFILKMAAMLKPSAEYNRRAAIEDLRAERSATKII